MRALGGHLIVVDVQTPQERMMLVGDGLTIARPNRGGKLQNKTLGRQIAQMGQPLYAFQAPTVTPKTPRPGFRPALLSRV